MRKRVLVFGSFVTDLCGRTNRLPVAGETVKGHYFKSGPGGKGSNQAVAAHRAGADVTFITKLGKDSFGQEALKFYKAENMSTDLIFFDREEPTGAALIIVDEATAQNQIVVIGGACEHFTDEDMPKILREVAQSDLLLLQLETNLEPVRAILKHAKKHNVTTVLNPAPTQHLEEEYLRCVDIITPNETEAQYLTGIKVIDKDSAKAAAKKLRDSGVGKVIITLGKDGSYAYDGVQEMLFETVDVGSAVDSTGAGDAFSGGLVTALAKGLDFFDAVVYGNTVAGISVTRHGTAPAMPYADEIEKVYNSL